MTLEHTTRYLFTRLIFIATSFLIITTCTEDKPTEPEKENNNIATSTIGVNGGELKTDDFSLIVPAGSFQGETTLSLSISDELSTFGESSISKPYIIHGLPSQFEKPIRVKIKYEGSLTDSTYIALSHKVENVISGDSIDSYRFISVVDSFGFILGFLKSNSSLPKLFYGSEKNSFENIKFQGFTGIQEWKNDQFIISATGGWSSGTLLRFGNILEQTYNHLKDDLRFGYYVRKSGGNCELKYSQWEWPITVMIADIESKIGLDYEHNWFQWDGPQIIVDGYLLDSSNEEEAKALFARALLILSLNTYDNFCSERKWLEYTAMDWFGGYFYDTYKNDFPSELEGNEQAPFWGIQAGSSRNKSDFRSHGKGMGTVIKYLEEYRNFKAESFSNVFSRIHNNNIHPTKTLLLNVDALVTTWWPDFFEKHISGNISDVLPTVFTGYNFLSDTWEINSSSDSIKIFTSDYHDLSAHRFMIDLNREYEDESARLILETSTGTNSDGTAIIVFSVDENNNLQHLVTARAEVVEIQNLKAYYQNGTKKFFVVVVNSNNNGTDYVGKTNIDLEMKVIKETTAPDYNRCGIAIYCGARFAYTTPDTSYESENDKYAFSNWEKYPGSFSGNMFTASYRKSWDSQTNPLVITGTLTATFNRDYTVITNIIWTESRNVHFTTFEGTNIPLDTNEWGTVYQVKMEETCNHIITLSDAQSVADGLSWTVPEYWCNGDSKIWISFSKE